MKDLKIISELTWQRALEATRKQGYQLHAQPTLEHHPDGEKFTSLLGEMLAACVSGEDSSPPPTIPDPGIPH